MRIYYVYLLASRHKTLYVGVTSNLRYRVSQHRLGQANGFTKKYNIHRLVHFEATPNVNAAINREKQIKAWRRDKKVALIERENPRWRDLSEEWDD